MGIEKISPTIDHASFDQVFVDVGKCVVTVVPLGFRYFGANDADVLAGVGVPFFFDKVKHSPYRHQLPRRLILKLG